MEFVVFGTIGVRQDEESAPLSGRLARTLLGVLLIRRNTPVSVDVLVDALWPGDARTGAARRLQLHVSRLRTLVGDAARLVFEQDAYQLTVRPGELDAQTFEDLLDQATELADTDPVRCAALVREALGLWRGEPYGGLDLLLVADEARRLGERRLAGLGLLYRAEIGAGRHAEVLPELVDLAARHPLDERLHGVLITALHRCGRPADALAAYRTIRRNLVEELGIEPGAELRELEARVLAGEPIAPAGGTPPVQRAEVPAQLPRRVRTFVGRDHELADLDDQQRAGDDTGDDTAPVVVISGTAGVGKTTLALRWAHQVRDRFPDGQLYADLLGYSPRQPASAGDVLAGFLRALGVDGAAIPHRLAERAARFRTLLHGRRMLVVLDNAASTEQVRPLLPGGPPAFVLVTSRDALAGLVAMQDAHRIMLDRLPTAEAETLVRSLLGDRASAEPAATRALIDRCARLPLALRVAAELVRAHPTTSVAGLVAELAQEQGQLDWLSIDGDPSTAVGAVFSWSYKHLSDPAERLFRLLGLPRGRDLDVHALAALAGTPLASTRRVLDELIRANLVEQTQDGRLRQHDLLRAYAADLAVATDSEADRHAALARLFDHYLRCAARAMDAVAPYAAAVRPTVAGTDLVTPDLSTHDLAVAWLDADRANLLLAVEHAAELRWAEFPASLSGVIGRYLSMGGFHEEALGVHERGRVAARALGDRAAQARALIHQGVASKQLGRAESSLVACQQGLVLANAIGDRALEATALNNIAIALFTAGRLRAAADAVARALALYRELAQTGMLVVPLYNLGVLRWRLGERAEATRLFHEALEVAERAGNLAIQSAALCGCARAHLGRGDPEAAIEAARRSVSLACESDDRGAEVEARYVLAVSYRQLGHPEAAWRQHEQAVAVARAIGDNILLVEALNRFAETQAALGARTGALRLHREAVETATAARYRDELARAHTGLGDVYADLGRAEARTHWELARAIYQELDLPDVAELDAKLTG